MPSGTHDHTSFEGRGKPVFSVSVIILVLASAFVFLRFVSRGAIVKKLGLDDYFMFLAWLLAFGMTFAVCWGTRYGLGRHDDRVPDEWEITLKKANYAFSVLYNPALMATKTSILTFYLTLSQTHRTFKWASIATLVVVNAGGFAITMLNVFQCTPIGALFNFPIPASAKCTDIVTIYLSSAPLNIITDLAILFLPMPILTKMRLPRKQKIILIVTFSFGIFVAAVDVVRIAYLQSAAQTRLAEIQNQTNNGGTASRTAENTDFPWYASLSFMWSVIEVNVGIMCACVPALKPLASRFMPHLLRSAGDVTEKSSSTSLQGSTSWEMAMAQRIPSVVSEPENAHRRSYRPEPHEEEGPMGMMDFLTTPDMNEYQGANLDRTQTALTNTTRNTQPNSPTFFDFVNMRGQKSMVQMTVRESIFPIIMVTVLFFIWGFEYGLLDVLNQQFQRVAHMTPGQTSSIHSAYYAGYILGPSLIGWPVLNHWGFKACYSIGLSIYACGTLIFWPSAVLTSYPAYLVTNIIVGTGLSVLEVSANPFIALCGPPEYAEIRLNLSQGVQAIGTVIAPLIANRAFFHRSFDAPSLVDTQYAYLGISLFTALLALVYHYIPLPEATNSELEDAAERFDGGNKARFGHVHVIWFILGLAAFSQFCYVGAQEVIGTEFESYLAQVVSPTWSGANYMAIAHTCFAVSRFLAAGLGYYIKPRVQIMFFFTGTVVFTALAMHLDGTTGLAMLMMVFFMEGPLFPLIFAQALRGMGRHTRLATVVMTSTISSGAVFSPISNHLTNEGPGAQYSLIVAAVVFGVGLVMPIGFSLHEKIRRLVDPLSGYEAADERPGSTSSRASRALSFLSIGKRPSKDNGAIEFRERTVSTN